VPDGVCQSLNQITWYELNYEGGMGHCEKQTVFWARKSWMPKYGHHTQTVALSFESSD
jgi:hypothetical protein